MNKKELKENLFYNYCMQFGGRWKTDGDIKLNKYERKEMDKDLDDLINLVKEECAKKVKTFNPILHGVEWKHKKGNLFITSKNIFYEIAKVISKE